MLNLLFTIENETRFKLSSNKLHTSKFDTQIIT